MQIKLDTQNRQARVVEVDDLRSLDVTAPAGMADADLAVRLGDLGNLVGQYVWPSTSTCSGRPAG